MKIEYSGTITHTGRLDLMAPPSDISDSYTATLKVYLVPPVTGSYVFSACADDVVKIWLSSDESSTNKDLVLSRHGGCDLQ